MARPFKNPRCQALYDKYAVKAPPRSVQGKVEVAQCNDDYWAGYDQPGVSNRQRGSLAYAAWCAGRDAVRREIGTRT